VSFTGVSAQPQARSSCFGLRQVQRRLRHAGSERGEGFARWVGVL